MTGAGSEPVVSAPPEGGPGAAPSRPISVAALAAELSRVADRLRVEQPAAKQLDPESRLRLQDLAQDIGLKRMYAKAALMGLGAELLIADAAFIYYMQSFGGKIPTAAIETWLGAIVIQVVGVVIVITRYLFPDRSAKGANPATRAHA